MPLTPLNALQVLPCGAHIPKVLEPSLASQCSLLVSWTKTKALGRSGSISDAQWSLSSTKSQLRQLPRVNGRTLFKYRVWNSNPLCLWPSPGGPGCCCLVPKAHPRSSSDSFPSPPCLGVQPVRSVGAGRCCTWQMLHGPARLCPSLAGCFLRLRGAGAPGQCHGSGSCPWQGLSPGLAGRRELCSHGHKWHEEWAVAGGTCGTLSPCWETQSSEEALPWVSFP